MANTAHFTDNSFHAADVLQKAVEEGKRGIKLVKTVITYNINVFSVFKSINSFLLHSFIQFSVVCTKSQADK